MITIDYLQQQLHIWNLLLKFIDVRFDNCFGVCVCARR